MENQNIMGRLIPNRNSLLQNMQSNKLIPESTTVSIIIRCLEKTYGFRTNQYGKNKTSLKNAIDEKSFNSFVRQEVHQKSKKDKEPFFSGTSKLLKVSNILLLLGCLLLTVLLSVSFDELNEIFLLFFSVFVCVGSIILGFVLSIVMYKTDYYEIDVNMIIKQKLDELAEKENSFNVQNGKKHLHWTIEDNFFWLELKINTLNTPMYENSEILMSSQIAPSSLNIEGQNISLIKH